jgi:hypothetical protein
MAIKSPPDLAITLSSYDGIPRVLSRALDSFEGGSELLQTARAVFAGTLVVDRREKGCAVLWPSHLI